MNKKNNKPLSLGFIGGGISSSIGDIHFMASQLDGKWKVVSGCIIKDLASIGNSILMTANYIARL